MGLDCLVNDLSETNHFGSHVAGCDSSAHCCEATCEATDYGNAETSCGTFIIVAPCSRNAGFHCFCTASRDFKEMNPGYSIFQRTGYQPLDSSEPYGLHSTIIRCRLKCCHDANSSVDDAKHIHPTTLPRGASSNRKPVAFIVCR